MDKKEANNKDFLRTFQQLFEPNLELNAQEKKALQKQKIQKARIAKNYVTAMIKADKTKSTEQKQEKVNSFSNNTSQTVDNALVRIKRDIGLEGNNYWQIQKGDYWTFRYLTEDEDTEEYITIYRRYNIKTGQFTERAFNFIYSNIWCDTLSGDFEVIQDNELKRKIQKQILRLEQQHKYGLADGKSLVAFCNGR